MRGTTTQQGYGHRWRLLRRLVLERDHYRCGWCGADAVTVDHVVPKSQGGTDAMNNLTAACAPCQYRRARDQQREANGWT